MINNALSIQFVNSQGFVTVSLLYGQDFARYHLSDKPINVLSGSHVTIVKNRLINL